MNRGDARLLFAIVASAIVAAIGTVLVVRLISSPDPKLQALAHRVEALEARPVLPEAPAPLPIAPEPRIDPLPAEPDPCDEVACVLNNYEAACCARFKKGPADSLDRAMISSGMAPVKAGVAACGEHSAAKGTVKVTVKVMPDGNIATVTVKTSPDTALGKCVAEAVDRAKFPATRYGGTFSYPFVF